MQGNPNPLISMIPVAAIFVIFYFLLIRPQQKQAKEHEKMLENLKKGDKIVTNGGIYGVIMGFRAADIELKIAENVKIVLARSAVARVVAATPAEATSNGAKIPSAA